MKLIYKVYFCLFVAATFSAACNKQFLDRPPLSQISTDNFYQTSNDLRLATAALYGGKIWGDWNYNCYLPVGEVLSGNMAVGYWGDAVQLLTFSVTGQNSIMAANWSGMYKVIAHCNVTINAIQQKSPATLAEKDKNAAIAEAKFIRGFAYYSLATLWGAVPIIEDNSKLINSPLVNRVAVEDVFKFITNDLMFAAQTLPVTDAPGRATTWSAQGMLAKVYLTMAGLGQTSGVRNQAFLDSAKKYAGNVCKKSGLSLLPSYANLFRTQYNDNPESLFALQWAPGGGWLEGNMLQIYSPGGAEISANGSAGWFSIRPTVDMFQLYTKNDSVRRKATFMLKGDYYPELNAAGGGYTFKGNNGLKKHIIGTNVDNNAPTMNLTSSAEHNSLLRLADVYLIYAESILGNNATTADADALLYFNKVRQRAGIDPVTVLNADSIFNERRIELAGEGHFWYDLVRLSYYNPQKAISILNKQDRGTFTYDNGTVTPETPFGIITPANSNTFLFPLPSAEVTANPKLAEPPVHYF
ncbi:carbohydrate-binding protein SusD [Niastella vici]|uniref:Carbohydrate-binding protein SusD n=1 Tax=Niastella vici TaxID=1703345 RepID=A0A1V9FQF9_9BACT|nr:RagB/SusD family nutrient uptake outer membrane protein [Niastella vici]OQP60527.1 carbohydrate-binding protein SusD [Niastella vici]